ncbi:hypothetical protein TVAG_050170 [Trichomonas vaginalis G3]|uniref:Uncharacterized protein n=1 Tax=Trichomonas vaginalis (strain ATCC PRA-98 / G3) TaxID=412133 RepID=A2EJE5_TRIV3|nr:nuclear pore membrane glycoprotein GP210-related family [Trichomonas vaginalis G3]EAY07202.1 hypothetical protein TVAG_050170 [Trichomonas vaginalis G3]KAI5533890.1 nuclear pore membrane glycoprotein GP210-related family [Trichomonas vaginalis G3]|eukprot:XP_001319425.1 hypothetical protein [Trichomonas vaginalis G3]
MFLCFSIAIFKQGIKLSHNNALLPFRRDSTSVMPSFVISNIQDSCVNWSSSNPSILKVTPIKDNDKCYKSAKVEVLYTGMTRMNTLIIAENEAGEKQSCNVYIDEVKEIEILTSTRTVYVDSYSQTISLQGFDGKQNIFTSIGHEANWQYDSNYFILDKNSIQKDPLNPTLSLKGISVGKSTIQAKLFNLVATAEISIVEQINLYPPNYIRVLPDVNLPFHLCTNLATSLSQCKPINKANQNQFTFSSSNKQIITINNEGLSHTHELGVASIIASDLLSDDNTATTIVNVTLPYSGYQKDQYILQGTDPVFSPKVFDEFGQEIYGSDQIEWTITGKWSELGENTITFSYFSFSFTCLVIVCPPIKINPDLIVLPPKSNWFIYGLTGGSGHFNISVKDTKIADAGNRQIRSNSNIGETELIVADNMINGLTASCKVLVSPVKSSYIVLDEREKYVNEKFLPLCGFTSESGHNYSITLQHEILSTNILIVDQQMMSKSPGFTKLFCMSNNVKTEEITVSVIDKLEYKIKGIASPNSHIPLHYTGGSLKWQSLSPPQIEISCENIAATLSKHYFSVDKEYDGLCTLKIRNKACSINPLPVRCEVNFELHVSNVQYLRIIPVDQLNSNKDIEKCNLIRSGVKITNEVKNLYNVVSNHLISFYVYCFNARDEIINYYSANPITFTADDTFIERVLIDEDTGYSVYKIKVTKTIDVLAHTNNAIDSSVTINVISPIIVESSKIVYFTKNMKSNFAITGGSGIFSVFGNNAVINDNGTFTVKPQTVGHYEYIISDNCTDQEPVKTALDVVTIDHLEIECPRKVIVKSETVITVNAYTSTNRLIPESVLERANIELIEPKYCERISFNKWIYKPDSLGDKTVTATATGCSKATKIITVVEPIVVNPQYIILMPKEIFEIDIKDIKYDVTFVSDDVSISRVYGNSIVAVSPGNTTVKVFCPYETAIPPAIIYVRVLKPIEILIERSSDIVVSGGLLFASFIIKTDLDDRYPLYSEITVQGSEYSAVNSSHIILECENPGLVTISCSCYNLYNSVKFRIEEKFELLCPQTVLISQGSYFEFKSKNDLPFVLSSNDNSIVTIDGHFAKSIFNKGITTINAVCGFQQCSVILEVIEPAAVFLNRTAIFVFKCLMVDKYGRFYTSLSGVSLELMPGKDFRHGAFDDKGFVQISTSENKSVAVTLVAKTNLFYIEKDFMISTTSLISPSGSITVMKGAVVPFTCTSNDVKWTTSDPKIGKISNNGQFKAISSGKVTISCDKSLKTSVKVLSMKSLGLEKVDIDKYQVIPVYDDNEHDKIIYPSDISLVCSWDSNDCGQVRSIYNSSGFFCFVERLKHHKCPEFSRIKAQIASPSSALHLKTDTNIPFVGVVDFGYPNWHLFEMEKDSRKSVLELNFGEDKLDYNCPDGWSISFRGRNAIVRAPSVFKGTQIVTFKHKESGEKLKLKFAISEPQIIKNESNVIDSLNGQIINIVILVCAILLIIALTIISKRYFHD